MKKYYISIALFFISSFIYSQDYYVSALSKSYNLHDTIQLKVIISRTGEYYHGIGLESKYNNKWFELEPTVNQIGKVEVFAKTIGPYNKIIKVVLPRYINQYPESDFPINIRFRLLEGMKIGKMDTAYSAPVLIINDKSK